MADVRINALATTATSSSSDDFIAIDGSANGTRKLSAFSPTFGGNLTVSGTGTSSVAGALRVTASSLVSNLTVGDTSNTFAAFIYGNNSANGVAIGTAVSTPAIHGYNNTFGAVQNLSLQPNGGNLLVGTTTDNGAKFQVEGYATFNRNGADGYLSVSRTSGATGTFGAGSTNSYLGTATNHPLVLYTNNTTALTLDSSQNATFAGTISTATNAAKNAIVARYNSSNSLFGITVNSAGQSVISENNDASTGSDKYSKTGLPAFRLGNTGGSGTVPFWIDVAASGTSGNAITWTNAFQIDSSQNATFAGTVRTTALGIGTAPNSYYTIYGTGTLTGNSNQAFLNAAPTFDSGATGQGNVLWLQGKTAAASYTVAALSGIKIESPSLGAGSSVTTVYGLRIQAQTGGTTNYAIYTDGGNVRFGSLPTSSAGLPSGAIWNNSGVLNIVP